MGKKTMRPFESIKNYHEINNGFSYCFPAKDSLQIAAVDPALNIGIDKNIKKFLIWCAVSVTL